MAIFEPPEPTWEIGWSLERGLEFRKVLLIRERHVVMKDGDYLAVYEYTTHWDGAYPPYWMPWFGNREQHFGWTQDSIGLTTDQSDPELEEFIEKIKGQVEKKEKQRAYQREYNRKRRAAAQ